MKLNYSESSLVIAGGWNPNIINPFWISKNLLGETDSNAENKENVSIDVQMDQVSSVVGSTTAASFREIRITVGGDRLDLSLLHRNDFTLLEKYALKICDCLPKTLVKGYGVNLVFTGDRNDENLVNIINVPNSKNFDTPLIYEQYNFGLVLDDIRTNISIGANNEEDRLDLRFNFHFDINDLSEFISGISKNSIHTLKEKATKIISDVYGLRLEN